MAARTMKEATPDDVRQWAINSNWTDARGRNVSDRGRLPSGLIVDFNKAMKRDRIEYPLPEGVTAPAAQAARTTPQATAQNTPTQRSGRRSGGSSDSTTVLTQSAGMAPVEGIQDLIAALSAAQSGGKRNGTPILVSAHTLVNV